MAPYSTQTAMATEDRLLPGDCVSDPSVEGQWEEEGGAEGSLGIAAELQDKRDIVARTDPSKKTLLPVPSDPASSAHELLASQNWKSLLKHHLLLYTPSSRQYSTNKMQRHTVNYGEPCI